MTRSLRFHLAVRFTVAMVTAIALIGVVSVYAFRDFLDRELEGNILEVAAIQGASATDSPTGGMHLHEWDLTPEEAASVRDLIRYVQIWNESGESLLRSQFMTVDLPIDREALAAAGRGGLTWRDQEFAGVPIRSLFYPLSRFGPAHAGHVIQVAAPLATRNALLRRLAVFLALVTLTVGVASFVGSWWLAGRAVRPIHQVIDQAEVIGAGSLDRRIEAYADTQEYHRLVAVLNTMLNRIQSAFESQRRFADDASHELRSPLTALRGEIELALKRQRTPDEYREVLASSLEEIMRLSRLTDDLLMLARLDSGAGSGGTSKTPLPEVAGNVVNRLRVLADAKDIRLLLEEKVAGILVDPGMIGPIVWNLTENAIKFTPHGGVVTVQLQGDESRLEISVTDTGPGLGDDPLRLFGRFVRADVVRTPGDATSGTGLGLAIVKSIVERYTGTIEATDRDGGGAVVRVVLPRSAFDRGSVRTT